MQVLYNFLAPVLQMWKEHLSKGNAKGDILLKLRMQSWFTFGENSCFPLSLGFSVVELIS